MEIKFRWETEFQDTEMGKVPKGWEVTTLDSIAYINKKMNKNKTSEIYGFINMDDIPTDGKYPFYKLLSREEIKSGIEVSKGHILLAKITPSFEHGKMCVVPDDDINWFATTEVFSIFPKDKNADKWYLFYLLKQGNLRDILEGSMTGTSGRQRVQLSALKSLIIPFPSPAEQSRIATVLSWFDDLIENKRRQNEILENTAMAIFKSWFVNFESFKDEKFVYSEELDREIPEGWEVKPIGEVAEFTNGFSYKGSEKFTEPVENAHVFITLNNILEGGGFKTEYTWIKSNRLKDRHYVQETDLIIANTEQTKTGRLLGSPAFVIFPPGYGGLGVFSHHLTKINPYYPELKVYLYSMIRTHQKEIAQTYHTGTGVWGFDVMNFRKNYHIIIPPQPILQRFHELVEPLFQKIMNNQKMIMVLKKVRDALLPLLVFGKLRVEEI